MMVKPGKATFTLRLTGRPVASKGTLVLTGSDGTLARQPVTLVGLLPSRDATGIVPGSVDSLSVPATSWVPSLFRPLPSAKTWGWALLVVLGFVVLAAPRTPFEVDWEVRDLLKTASRQAASYLGEIRATEALLEARKFDAFNRMSAFVVHDLKNLVAQLSLMLRNAQRHRDNPRFQSDMLATVEHVVGRMNALMLQLRTGAEPAESPAQLDVEALVRRVCATKADPKVTIEFQSLGGAVTLGHADRLEHVIGHLLQNAIDASHPRGRISVRVEPDERFVNVIVSDEGVGMTAEFIRERLFRPFQTTKSTGMGIGVYESAQYVERLGGEIQIDSAPGAGTRVRARLPRVDVPGASEHGAAVKERVA
jgi:putative PEP-CTERM system histidine kinase